MIEQNNGFSPKMVFNLYECQHCACCNHWINIIKKLTRTRLLKKKRKNILQNFAIEIFSSYFTHSALKKYVYVCSLCIFVYLYVSLKILFFGLRLKIDADWNAAKMLMDSNYRYKNSNEMCLCLAKCGCVFDYLFWMVCHDIIVLWQTIKVLIYWYINTYTNSYDKERVNEIATLFTL